MMGVIVGLGSAAACNVVSAFRRDLFDASARVGSLKNAVVVWFEVFSRV